MSKDKRVGIVPLYEELQGELTVLLAQQLSLSSDLMDIDVKGWEQAKLYDTWRVNAIIREAVLRASKKRRKTVKQWLSESSTRNLQELRNEIRQLKGEVEESVETIESQIERLETEMNFKYDVIDRTIVSNTMAVYSASIIGMSKIGNYEEAVSKIVIPFSQGEVGKIRDSKGRNWQPAAYVGLTEKANERNVRVSLREILFDENDIDLVEISDLSDSRPSHIEYQGNIYSRSGNSRNYPPLSDTGYGEVDGIEGINCRHRVYGYVEGVSVQRYMPTEDVEETEREYNITQRQRELERRVRASKREIELSKTMGVAVSPERELILKNRQDKLANHVKKHNRKRNYKRESLDW